MDCTPLEGYHDREGSEQDQTEEIREKSTPDCTQVLFRNMSECLPEVGY